MTRQLVGAIKFPLRPGRVGLIKGAGLRLAVDQRCSLRAPGFSNEFVMQPIPEVKMRRAQLRAFRSRNGPNKYG